jgi:polygalacturonase
MSDDNDRGLTRREWVTIVSAPAIAAALGSTLLTGEAAAVDTLQQQAGRSATGVDDRNLVGARVFNVRDFGAKGDGTALDTDAVQAAIDAATADRGGTVLIPAGDFVVGTIELKSYVTLHVAAGGRLLGSPDPAQYRAGNGIPPGNGNIVLLSAHDADNVTIEGRGTIDGNGAKFYTGRGDMTGPGQNSSQGYFQRPHLMVFHECRNLLMRDVFLTASAYHCVRILSCRHVRFDGVRIHNRVNLNNDGFHFNSCEYVNVTNCNIACQDDACALFGSNKYVTVTNCSFSTRWSIFRFGGGHAENIAISNCVIYETYGCAIKMRCGNRSRFENISFSNLVMKDVTGPISIGLDSTPRRRSSMTTTTTTTTTGSAASGPAGGPAGSAAIVAATAPATAPVKGVARNISFNHIRATVVAVGRTHADLPFTSNFRPGETRSCIVVNGANDETLEQISFSDVHVTYEGGGTAEEAAREVPQLAGEYFEIGTPPAYGLYARGVRGLTLHNVRFDVTNPDVRPAVVFDRVDDASVNGITVDGNPQAAAALRFVDTRDVLVAAPRLLSPAATFLKVEGKASAGIKVDGGDVSKATTPLAAADGAGHVAARGWP